MGSEHLAAFSGFQLALSGAGGLGVVALASCPWNCARQPLTWWLSGPETQAAAEMSGTGYKRKHPSHWSPALRINQTLFSPQPPKLLLKCWWKRQDQSRNPRPLPLCLKAGLSCPEGRLGLDRRRGDSQPGSKELSRGNARRSAWRAYFGSAWTPHAFKTGAFALFAPRSCDITFLK